MMSKHTFLSFLLAACLSTALPLAAQDADEICTVSILNQTAYVQADGSWFIPDVPDNMGPIRARINCLGEDGVRSGASDLFTITTDRQNSIPPIGFDFQAREPERIEASTDRTRLSVEQPSAQLTVRAVYPDGSSDDVTAREKGTTYISSNDRIASVSGDGRVTARSSGRALISVLHEAILDTVPLEVVLSGDQDGDGIPDDWEVANGLDPDDPLDAFGDADQDGLSTEREFQLGTNPTVADTDGDGLGDGTEVETIGTNPALFDTDGDGFSDGLEIQLGTDPLDPQSFDLESALVEFTVEPTSLALVFNTLLGEAGAQLEVTGELVDGTRLDLRSPFYGTSYFSSDLTICNFGSEPGMVFGGSEGSCTVSVTNSGIERSVEIVVRAFTPVGRSELELPGYANGIDVVADIAHVAAGAAGLQLVDVSDPDRPSILAALDTSGNANDVHIRDNLAAIADGTGGLVLADVSDPLAPRTIAAVPTSDDALDVAIRGDYVFVAAATAGLEVYEISDPTAPAWSALLPLSGTATGLAAPVDRDLVVVVAREGGIHTVDGASPESPVWLATLELGDPRDVALRGDVAWVADFQESMTAVDLEDPTFPVNLGSVDRQFGGLLNEIAIGGDFAFGADVFFANGIPIVDIHEAESPRPMPFLDLGAFSEANGMGLDTEAGYVYLTASETQELHGSSGTTWLFVAQYLTLEDDLGVAPEVRLVAPAPGPVTEGSRLTLEAEAKDDVGVMAVDFLVNGLIVGSDDDAPYRTQVDMPPAPAELEIEAVAWDFSGSRSRSEIVSVESVERPVTALRGTVVDPEARTVEGAGVVTDGGRTGLTTANGSFLVDGVVADGRSTSVHAAATVEGIRHRGRSPSVVPIEGQTVDVGEIELNALVNLYPGATTPTRPVGSFVANDVVIEDLDGDSIKDLIFLVADGSITRHRGLGHGRHELVQDFATTDILLRADIIRHGDGTRSLVAIARKEPNLWLFPIAQGGSLGTPRSLEIGTWPKELVVADLDGDALEDVAVINGGTHDIALLFQTSDYGLAEASQQPGTGGQLALTAFDLDRDGDLDLLVGDAWERIVWHENTATGFQPPNALAFPVAPRSFQTADIDGDDRLELIVGGIRDGKYKKAVTAFVGDNGSLETRSSLTRNSQFGLVDWNEDGFLDVAYPHRSQYGNDQFRIDFGDGTGYFGSSFTSFPSGGQLVGETIVTDLDGDRFDEVLVLMFGLTRIDRTRDFLRGWVGYSSEGTALAWGDFDGDGLTDFATGYPEDYLPIRIYLQRPDLAEGFELSSFESLAAVDQLHAADLDSDGLLDLVTLDDSIVVYQGQGDGAFLEGWSRGGQSSRDSVVVDFDRDGAPDILTLRADTNELVVWRNDGGGDFQWDHSVPANFTSILESGDFDGNGWPDAAAGRISGTRVTVWMNREGQLAPGESWASGESMRDLAVLDVDLDGNDDLATVDTYYKKSSLSLIRGAGDGSFLPPSISPTDGGAESVAAGDLDRDGFPDLAIAHVGHTSIHLNSGSSSFQPPIFVWSGHPSEEIWVTDVDPDGYMDLLVGVPDQFVGFLRQLPENP